MTYDYDAGDKAFEDANPDEGGNWLEAGEHTCIIDDSYIDEDDYGTPRLILKLKENGTGAMGMIRQSFNPQYIVWLKKLIRTLGKDWTSLKQIERECGSLVDMVVEVTSKQNGQYTNHYINAVVDGPAKTEDEGPAKTEDKVDYVPF